MKESELALTYMPYILFDITEPFDVKGIGYSIYLQSAESKSFNRFIQIDSDKTMFAIEYEIYFDYDIQHLYDLEHIWVFVGPDEKICGVEGSFHGLYLRCILSGPDAIKDSTHVHLFCQPGKHAFMADGNLFRMKPDWYTSCNAFAGKDGILIPDMFCDILSASEEVQDQVRSYIRKHYSFQPTLHFEYRPLDDGLIMSWEKLKMMIPERIKNELSRIRNNS